MIDLVVYRCNYKYSIYEIRNGKRVLVKEIEDYEYNEVIDYINANYEYARLLLGNCIE